MPYRETAQVRRRKRGQQAAILAAARARIAEGGYRAAQMQALARDAGIATGTLYRYFPSKAQLFAQVFQTAVRAEVDAVEAVAGGDGTPAQRLAAVVETFVRRALRAPRLAYALLAEPVDPLVETERLVYRRSYAQIFRRVIEAGIADGEFATQDPALAAAGLVGLLNETLTGPLSPTESGQATATPDPTLVNAIVALCLRAVGHAEH